MTDWLPSLPASAIDSSSVERFLADAHPESNTHDYKVVGETKRLPEVVSALANTYGGVVIVGVPDSWTGDFSTLGDVDAAAESRIVDQLIGDLDPSWLPTLIPVEVARHRLLVLKVDTRDAPRPLLARGRGYLKREKRKVPASWFDLRSLYQSEPSSTPLAPSLNARFLTDVGEVSSLLGDGAPHPQSVWRIVAGYPTWPTELRDRHADATLRDWVRDAMRSTPLDEWVRWFTREHELACDDSWHDVPPSHIGTASFAIGATPLSGSRAGPRVAAHLQLDVSNEPRGPSGGGIAATINLMLWPNSIAEDRSIASTGAIQQGRLDEYVPRFVLADIGDLLDILVRTVEAALSRARDALVDNPSTTLIGPNLWVVGDLDRLWDLGATGLHRPANNLLGSHRGFDSPSSFPTSDRAREITVDTWLQRLLLTAGFVPGGSVWPQRA